MRERREREREEAFVEQGCLTEHDKEQDQDHVFI